MPDYAQMTQLTKVSVELEDCFGVGIYRFLRMVGHQLTELSLSCSSGKLFFLELGDQTNKYHENLQKPHFLKSITVILLISYKFGFILTNRSM